MISTIFSGGPRRAFRARTAAPSIVALFFVTGTSALATDTYVASLPDLQRSLHTSSAVAQLTMTGCIAGMALGQLVAGPISDARGRRGIVLTAALVFSLMSIICAVTSEAGILLCARVIQGAAAGTSVAVGRAVVNDTWRGRAAAATFGTLTAVGLLAPVIAPAIGSGLAGIGGWRLVFWFLALVGLAMTGAAAVGLPESLPAGRRHPGGLAQLRVRAGALVRDRAFIGPVLTQCCTSGGFFVYIGGSSFVLQRGLGLSRQQYTLVFMINALAMVSTSVLFRAFVMRLGPFVLRRLAVALQTGAVALLLVGTLVAADHRPSPVFVCCCLAGMTAGLGCYFPSNSSIAQEAGRRYAGTASALSGGLPFLTGAFTTPLTGLLGSQTPPTMASCMAVGFGGAAVLFGYFSRTTPPRAATGTEAEAQPVAAAV